MENVPHHIHDGVDSPKVKQTKVRGVYAESEIVKLTTDQTIAGIKTFTSIPVLPASNPTTDNQAVRKAYMDGLIPSFEIVASDTVRDSANSDALSVNASWLKVKEIQHNDVDGTIRVSFALSTNITSGTANTVHARVYINGTAVGIDRSNSEFLTNPITYTEDFDVTTDDLVQLYVAGTAGASQAVANAFQIKYDKVFAVTPGTVNSD